MWRRGGLRPPSRDLRNRGYLICQLVSAAIDMMDGVPTAIKDIFLTKGWPTRRGSKIVDPDQPWEEDAPSTARLRGSSRPSPAARAAAACASARPALPPAPPRCSPPGDRP